MDDLLYWIPMLLVILLILKLIVGGGAFASKSKKLKLNSEQEFLRSEISRVRGEIRDLDRQITNQKKRR